MKSPGKSWFFMTQMWSSGLFLFSPSPFPSCAFFTLSEKEYLKRTAALSQWLEQRIFTLKNLHLETGSIGLAGDPASSEHWSPLLTEMWYCWVVWRGLCASPGRQGWCRGLVSATGTTGQEWETMEAPPEQIAKYNEKLFFSKINRLKSCC